FRKKRPTDRNMPPKIEAFVPESKLYMELTEFEKSLDATILRKRLDIQEALGKPTKLRRTLRVFVSNTSSDQSGLSNENGGESFDLTNGQAPSWTLKIEGTLLDSANSTNQSLPTPKFTSFFRSIVVDLERDPAVYPEGNVIEWHKQPGNADHDGIEIKRKGDTSVKARIILELDYNPPTFKLAPALASLLDMKQDIKPNIVMAIWDYVKHHKLQDAEDKRIIHCDQRLMQIFGAPQIHFSQLPDLINRHLARPDPIVIPYTIRVDKPLHQSSNAFDIEVEQDSPLRQKMMEVIASSQMQKDVSGLDDKILQCVQSINNSKIKRDFLLQFSENPVDFINKWMASQARDLESQQRMQELIDSQRPPHP
ncbi:uncharacterized protein BYT42DRAFT_505765, partial [Radiomyces spectabilis]|uniref:uncharacterized protein n=1 Tax=Radiomyces spectabilis TaxID=64574 RepID=UPI0022205E68